MTRQWNGKGNSHRRGLVSQLLENSIGHENEEFDDTRTGSNQYVCSLCKSRCRTKTIPRNRGCDGRENEGSLEDQCLGKGSMVDGMPPRVHDHRDSCVGYYLLHWHFLYEL